MSDINLINNPGIQGSDDTSNNENNILSDNNYDTDNINVEVNRKTNKI